MSAYRHFVQMSTFPHSKQWNIWDFLFPPSPQMSQCQFPLSFG